MRKKGIFFSSDALIALVIIFLTLMIFAGFTYHSREETKTPSDLIGVFSNLKIGEINNSYVKTLIDNGDITDKNNTILEQIGEFYVENETLAKNLAQSILTELSPEENVGIWYDDKLIASVNNTPIEDSENIEVEEQLISGLKKGGSVTGFSSRAYLENNLKTKYFYFGGYVGDGNISVNINYSGDVESIKLEIASNEDFDAYINGNFSGHYQNSSSDFIPAVYDLSAYGEYFKSGNNIIKLVGENNDLHIAGGYLKVTFENSSIIDVHEDKTYNFPGIAGLINIYDSFYIPNELRGMDIFLHYDSEEEIFLNIGNTTVYNGSNEEETTIHITDQELSGKLNYDSLINKTIPLRLGMRYANYTKSLKFSLFSVAPLPASFSSVKDNEGNQKEDVIINANQEFAKSILRIDGSEIGLVGIYGDQIPESFSHNLSTNYTSLNNTMNNWELKSGVCLCCGINESIKRMVEQSDPLNIRHILIMADKEPTSDCGSGDPVADSINIACDAYEEHGIVFDTVALGGNEKGELMLQEISNCSNGSYFEGAYENTTETYLDLSEKLAEIIYSKQTALTEENLSGELFSDSYIRFDYDKPEAPYGLILTDEKNFYDAYEGNFSLPENSSILEATVISYSGPRWTSMMNINNQNIYNLSRYGSDFPDLGDPYALKIPNNYVEENNTIRLTTALSPGNESKGSEENKIIYKIIKKLVSYSPITSYSEGCVWDIDFEEGGNKTLYVPEDYNGDNQCYYKEGNINYDENDATQVAVYELLREADFDNNGKVDVIFSGDNLVISSSQITGIPYSWSTRVQIRRWD